MTDLDTLVKPADLRAAIESGHVSRRQHPELPLSIYTYTRVAQYERAWSDVTIRCRGLVADDVTGAVVAWPFEKFFNVGEHGLGLPYAPPLPVEPFEVYDKVDGCFPTRTALNLWGGGTITIGEVVRRRLPVNLVGMDERGNLVPAVVIDWHRNGRKDHWLDITVDAPVSRVSGAGGHPNRLRVTVNHEIHVNGGYRLACEVRPGDEVVTQTWEPSNEVLRLIRASMLGDGCVVASATKAAVAKYQEPHTVKHSAYVEAIQSALGDCATNRVASTSGYGSALLWAGSREYAALGDLRREWYPDGIKRVPADLSWLDDFAVAKWIMDDGSLSTGSHNQQPRLNLATNSFAQEDVQRLADRLAVMYGVRCKVYEDRGWCLRVNAGRDRSIDRLWAAVAPHVHPSMRYKIPERWRDIPYTQMAPGREVVVPKTARVLRVEPVAATKANFPHGRIGYDITTSTSNYLARGVLVHNSLGIVFHYDARWHVASKGSFTSEQATWATRRLRAADTGALDPGSTYLVEILYPENRIVVNYGERRDLVLLAAYGPDGTERALTEAAGEWRAVGSVVRSWPAPELGRLLALTADNIRLDGQTVTGTDAEGYVLRFASGVRTKAKTADYVRLHRVITGVTERDIWRSLGIQRFADRDPKRLTQTLGCSPEELAAYAASGTGPLDALLEQVPDEFDAWVRGIADGLVAQADALAASAREEFAALAPFADDRAAFARAAQRIGDRRVRGTMFQLLDGQNVDLQFWRAIKPGPSDPFANDEEG
ncbi:hypothetical protein ABZ721_22110 [Streptomyces sp. NPDC006733]|uniref:hypothetical protein n=1 Tax=Streptomyces sp. NPDC006733 TaxID=3155460 RepID=UPI003408315A